jgi:Serine dehydrogenase proteinase
MAEEQKLIEIAPGKQPQAGPGPFCDPPELCRPISAVAAKIRKQRGRPLLVLVTEFVDDGIVDRIYAWRKDLCEAARANKSKAADIDILIDSPGGDLNSCFIAARLLGRWLNSWEALIPGCASSGATMICLGSSNIVMSQRSQLGPLDPRAKFFGGERRSPFEAFQALRELRALFLDSLDKIVEFLLERKVASDFALEKAMDGATRLVQPMLAKIEPCEIGIFALNRAMALEYCRRVAAPADEAKKAQRAVDAEALVEAYPAHEFAIDFQEARALNFAVSEATPEMEDLFDELRPLFEEIRQYVGFLS